MDTRILIIEDDRIAGAVLKRVLDQAGYSDLTWVQSAEDAFFIVYEKPFDVVLIDWMLPGVSGLEFARHLRAHPYYEETPLIMITAKGDRADIENAIEAGVDDYFRKPERGWQPQHGRELVRRIESHTDTSRDISNGSR